MRQRLRTRDSRAAPRVLVVDDLSTNRALLLRLLGSAGFEVLEAENGREAVMLAETWRPDVVLMDLQMPQLNGFEATRLIKRSAWGAQIPIIILSADCEVSNSADALAAGALSFMAKPFIDAEILAALGSALNLTYA